MKFFAVILAGACLLAGAASADMISAFDEKGGKKAVDTASLSGCVMLFDSAGQPFQICKMEKVEFRPPNSSRARPGHEDRVAEAQVMYKRADN
jgi:hypothetical protein